MARPAARAAERVPSLRSSIVAKDVEARERLKARIEAAVAGGRLERGAGARRPLQFRPAGRLPRAVPRHRAGRRQAREDRGASSRRHARGPAHRRPSSQLGRDECPRLRLEVDQARARALGLTPQDIAQTLQTLIGGVTVTTIRAGEERIDVVARAVAQRARRARSDRRSHHRRARRRRDSRRPGRACRAHDRGADHLAQGPRTRRDGAGRRRRWRAAA